MKQIAAWIDEVISHHTDDHQLESIKEQIKILTDQFLLYPSLTY